MLSILDSSQVKKFLKKVDKQLAVRLIRRIEKLANDPFPKDVKRVVNQKEKVFRVRVGDYRIQYMVLYDRNLLFISEIDKRPRAYLH
jgi:mRNA interferase RelE/StbE